MMVSSVILTIAALAASVICAQESPSQHEASTTEFRERAVGNSAFKLASHGKHTTTLRPVLDPHAGFRGRKNLIPSKHVSLNWGAQGNSLVNVSLSMIHPTVLLEEIEDIKTVDCEPESVTISFNDEDSYNEALADWSDNGNFTLVTNHLGDCDAENERGLFLAYKITGQKEKLSIVATGEKTDVNTAADSTEIVFSSVPISSPKRDSVKWDGNGLKISNTLSLPKHTTLFKQDPYIEVSADSGEINTQVTLSGKLSYSVSHAKLNTLSFDITGSIAADLALSLDIKAPYKHTFSYEPLPLAYNLIDVPGIIKLGPALAFKIGADVGAEAGVHVASHLSTKLDKGNFHIDFINTDQSSATGWVPTFNAVTNITEKAAVSVDPFIDVTVELGMSLIEGALDLSGGITAQPRLNNDFTLTATQSVDGNGQVTQPKGDACPNGLAIQSEFQFSVTAFVTQFWKKTIYTMTKPIAKQCYTWL